MVVFCMSAAHLNKLSRPRGLRNSQVRTVLRHKSGRLAQKMIWCVSKWDHSFLTVCGLYFWARVHGVDMNSVLKRWSQGYPYTHQPHTVKQPNLETQLDD